MIFVLFTKRKLKNFNSRKHGLTHIPIYSHQRFSVFLYKYLYKLYVLTKIFLCFNPYSYGCCFWIKRACTLPVIHAEFQSLFLWMLLLNNYLSFNPCSYGCCFWIAISWVLRHRWSRVSILVLMDVAFEFVRDGYNNTALGCFNPCSYGCCFWISTPIAFFAAVFQFQSLFLWMLLLNKKLYLSLLL